MSAVPPPRARPEIHRKVSQLVDQLGSARGKKALDAPLGPGGMAFQLHELGYDVSGVDLDLAQSDGLSPAIKRVRCDLNTQLPFDDAVFDLVTSLEGIEHVENHFQMARELGRVTRPGGHLIISTPNICNLEERLNFLARGSFYRFISRAEFERNGSGFDHQNLIGYVELRQVLAWAGFQILSVERDRAKWKQNVFLAPLWLFVRAYAAVQSAKRGQKYLLGETIAGPVLLGGNTIILLARKSLNPGRLVDTIPGQTTDATTVSVVIITRNTCAFTRAAIRSVLDGRDSFIKEIVVVDNGSTDGTQAVLAREFPPVRLLRSDTNLGFARANNLGARAARGEFLLLLNSDARLQPESLGIAVEWMRAHPRCGIAGAQLLNPDGSPQNSIANFPSIATELLNKSLLRRIFPRRFPGKERRFTLSVTVESVIGAFMLIRADLWRELGGFDERYFFFFEETDFCLRARRRGWEIFHLPQVLVWHEQGKSAKQVPIPARVEYWRSRYAYFTKNHSALACSLLAVGLRARLLANWLAAGLLALLTLGRSTRRRGAWTVNHALLRWHLKGCPPEPCLPR